MSYSATTGKLGLPQWVKGTKDHPDFLTDMNQAFEKIDRFAERIDNTVDGLPGQVDELAALVESMQDDVGEHTTELASLGVRTGVLETETDNLGVRVGSLVTRIGDAESAIDKIVLFSKIISFGALRLQGIESFISDDGVAIKLHIARYCDIVGFHMYDTPTLKALWPTLPVGVTDYTISGDDYEGLLVALQVPEGAGLYGMTRGYVRSSTGETIGEIQLVDYEYKKRVIRIRKYVADSTPEFWAGVIGLIREDFQNAGAKFEGEDCNNN